MKTTDPSRPNRKPIAILVGLPALLIAALVAVASADRSYQGDQLGIQNVEVLDDGSVQIAFFPIIETMWYCPGANAKVTDKGLELKFVRASFKKKPDVDYPATTGTHDGKPVKIITLPKGTKTVFVREGKTLRKIFPTGG